MGKNEIRLYRKFNHFIEKLSASRNALYRAYENIQLYSSTIPHKLLETVAIGSILALAVYAYTSGDFQALAFMIALFGSVAFRMLPSINRVLTSINTIHANEHLLDYIPDKFLKAQSNVTFQAGINLEEVSFAYGDKQVINNLSLNIQQGDYLGVSGPNGSGKSTLSQLLLGLLLPSSGKITIINNDIEQEVTGPLQAAAYVSQNPYLLEASIAENISFGDDADEKRIETIMDRLNLGEWLNQLDMGINTPIGERGTTISGGQAQRISLARALYKEPKLLVLDEALNAVDDYSLEVVLNHLKHLNKEGLTIVQIAHDKREIIHATKNLHLG